MTNTQIIPRFRVGDRVAAVALLAGSPHARPRIEGLVVSEVRMIEDPIPYYLVTTRGPVSKVEGAEHFFEPDSRAIDAACFDADDLRLFEEIEDYA